MSPIAPATSTTMGSSTLNLQGTPRPTSAIAAVGTGFQAIATDDHDNMAKQFPAYDALYAYCRATTQQKTP